MFVEDVKMLLFLDMLFLGSSDNREEFSSAFGDSTLRILCGLLSGL